MEKQKNLVNTLTSYNVWLDDTETIDSKEFYNESGQIIKIEYYSPRGVLTKMQEWQYGTYGSLEVYIFNNVYNDLTEIIKYEKLYTETGYTKTTSKNGECVETLVVTVSNQGELLHEVLTTINQGVITEIIKTSYFEASVMFEQQLRNSETNLLESGYVKVNKYLNNELVSCVDKDQNGEVHDEITIDSSGTITTHSKSDEYNGKKINTKRIKSFSNKKICKLLFFENEELIDDQSFIYAIDGTLQSEKSINSFGIIERNHEWHSDGSRALTELFFSVTDRHTVQNPLPWAQCSKKIWQFNVNENVVSFKEYDENGLRSSMRWDYVYWQ